MAKKYYLATYSWSLNQDIPTAKPRGFVWRASKNLYLKLEEPPTFSLIFKLALKAGADESGFRVDAVSEVPDKKKKKWSEVDVFEETEES